MSISADRTTYSRIQKELGDLRAKEADEVKKQSDLTKKINAANTRASKASSAGSAAM